MKWFAVSAAFVFSTVTAQQAVACDMGAIETWVALVCGVNGCATKSITKHSAEGCDGSNCTKLPGEVRLKLKTFDSLSNL